MSAQHVVELSGVTLFRGETVILKGISWRIARGEHWAVIGANGSGKTTLLRIVSGYLWPSDGGVTVLGETFGRTDIQKLRQRIGWVSSALHDWVPPHETALATVLTGQAGTIGSFEDPTEADIHHADGLLSFFDCAHVARHKFGTLSQGEQQKILIARGLMPKPELLVLDEVCAGLDLAARESFLHTLETLAGQPSGPTLIFVTHHIEEIIPPISHVLVLKGGRVLAQGPKEAVLTDGVLQDALGLPLALDLIEGRYWPRMRAP